MSEQPAVQISHEDQGRNRRFVARADGVDGEGELVLTVLSDTLVRADHTFVPDTMRGMGVALAMVQALIADARAKAYRIVPQCPYVRAQAQKHPEWADVIERQDG